MNIRILNTPIFATLKDENGNECNRLFSGAREYLEATFSPEVENVSIFPLVIRGKTYAERKKNLRKLAVDIQGAGDGGLSWGECIALFEFFRKNGKRYGLLREFEENWIC